MRRRHCTFVCLVRFALLSLVAIGMLTGSAAALAAPPWQSLIPFKRRVEADPNKTYTLTEDHGPWMILAATFTSMQAEKEARDLVLEMRSRYNVPAYMHEQVYDFTEPVEGRGVDRYGRPKKMRYVNATKFSGYAVLVGEFETFDDPQAQKTLDTIKSSMPRSLNPETGKWTIQRWKVVQKLRDQMNMNDERDQRGPLGAAFITRNPLLPEEYFNAGGLDDFVIDMNKGVEHSLLDNPGKFTVQVATFGGEVTVDPNKVEKLSSSRDASDKLVVAADKAHRLTLGLRRRGVEAYEFHDRFASIVTIGSFNEYEAAGPNGQPELRKDIREIIATYSARPAGSGGQTQFGIIPKTIDGISCDATPTLVEVPRRSVGAAYARTASR